MENENISPNPPEASQNSGQPGVHTFDNPNGESTAEPSTSLGEKIRGIAGAAMAKANGVAEAIKRGRGRPKNCATCGKPETQCVCQKVAALAGAAPSEAAPPGNSEVDFEAEIVTMLTDSVIGGVVDICNAKIIEFGPVIGDEKYCEDLARRLTPEESDLQKIGKLTHIVLKKHEVSTKHLPEMVLAASVLNLFVGYGLALRTLSKKSPSGRKIISIAKP